MLVRFNICAQQLSCPGWDIIWDNFGIEISPSGTPLPPRVEDRPRSSRWGVFWRAVFEVWWCRRSWPLEELAGWRWYRTLRRRVGGCLSKAGPGRLLVRSSLGLMKNWVPQVILVDLHPEGVAMWLGCPPLCTPAMTLLPRRLEVCCQLRCRRRCLSVVCRWEREMRSLGEDHDVDGPRPCRSGAPWPSRLPVLQFNHDYKYL